MVRVSRRALIAGSGALSGLADAVSATRAACSRHSLEVGKVDPVAPDVYFHEGDIEKGFCNNGWVVFEDYVLVVDANFPAGAQVILPKIRALTDKPIRFAFDTHHHGDHTYGNQTWVESGATPVAHTGVIDEMRRYETGYFDAKPGRWEESARERTITIAARGARYEKILSALKSRPKQR